MKMKELLLFYSEVLNETQNETAARLAVANLLIKNAWRAAP